MTLEILWMTKHFQQSQKLLSASALGITLLLGLPLSHLFATLLEFPESERVQDIEEVEYIEEVESSPNERQDLNLKLKVPDRIFLPIPNPKSNHRVSVKLRSLITNQSSFVFRSQGLVPELSSNNTTIESEFYANQGFVRDETLSLRPGNSINYMVTLSLFWQRGKLYMQNDIPFNYTWISDVSAEQSHRLELTYQYNNAEISSPNPLRIYLTEPSLLQDSNPEGKLFIQADNIQFEVSPQTSTISLPDKQNPSKIPIEFNILALNIGSGPVRLNEYHSLSISLIQEDSDILLPYMRDDALSFEQADDFPLVMPGETANLNFKGNIFWQNNKLYFEGFDDLGGFWSFDDLQLGHYNVQLAYQNSRSEVVVHENGSNKVLKNLWTGLVILPMTKIELVEQ
jgi:hypothetical protein